MNQKILYLNGFRAKKALENIADDPRVQEIEGYGMDEGRVFIHLNKGYIFADGNDTRTHSVGSVEDIKYAMKRIVKED